MLPATVTAFVVAEAAVLLAALGLGRRALATSAGASTARAADRLTAPVRRLPAPAAAAAVLLAGWLVVLAVCFVLGRLAGAAEGVVDVPLFGWAERELRPGTTWHAVWTVLTTTGNRRQIQAVVVVAGLALALAWHRWGRWARRGRRGRRALVPPVALATAYLLEKAGQYWLKTAVHRGHPPTTRGTWPSGGCARLVVVHGLVAVLVVLVLPPARRRLAAVLLGTLVAVLAVAEAYSRVYLLKHWFTDVVGGLLYGALLLAVVALALRVLVRGGAGGLRPAVRGSAAGSRADPR